MQVADHAGPAPMTLAFDMDAVEKWAQFSSDRNPIHFDIEHARLAGLDALIVHGMLALMPVKESVSGAGAPDGWMKFKSLLRNPIPHGEPIAFDAKPAARGLSFQVRGGAGQLEHFRGTYRPAEDPVAELQGEAVELQAALDCGHAERFAQFYPDVRQRWIALDAIVFSEFMRTRLQVVEDIAQAHVLRLGGGAHTSRVVVQSSHSVTFDAAFFDALGGPETWTRFSHGMLMPEMIASGNQLGGTVSLPVMWEDRLVMLVELGLVSKFGSLNSN